MGQLLQALTDAVTRAVTRAAITGAVVVFAILVGLGGVATLFGALFLALAEVLPPTQAALVTALAAFATCGLLLLLLRLGSRGSPPPPRRNPAADPEDESLDRMVTGAMELGETVRQLVERNKREAAISAFVIGLVSGATPAARQRLRDVFKAFGGRAKRDDSDRSGADENDGPSGNEGRGGASTGDEDERGRPGS